MITTTERVLALGGEPRWSYFERQQRPQYLPRILVLAIPIVLIVSTLTSQLFKSGQIETQSASPNMLAAIFNAHEVM